MSIVRCQKMKQNKQMHNQRAIVRFQSKLLRANRFVMALPCVCILCLLSIECHSIEQYTIVLMAYGIRTCTSLSRNKKRKQKEEKRKVSWLKIASELKITGMTYSTDVQKMWNITCSYNAKHMSMSQCKKGRYIPVLFCHSLRHLELKQLMMQDFNNKRVTVR